MSAAATVLPRIARTTKTKLPVEHEGREVMLDAIAFQGASEREQILVLVHRKAGLTRALPIVRIHSGCVTGDIFHSLRCDCYAQLKMAMTSICEAPIGVMVYLPYQEGRGIGLFQKLESYAQQDLGLDTVDANVAIGAAIDDRDYSLAAEALRDLGMPTVRLLSNNPAKKEGLMANGIRVVELMPLISGKNKFNERYLETKRSRMNHLL